MGDLLEWSKKEVDLVLKRITDEDEGDGFKEYTENCYKSALKAFESLCGDGHSGMSIMFTKSILNRLIDAKPLTEINDIDDEWTVCIMCPEHDGHIEYQCKRYSSLFKTKYPDGSVSYYDINRFVCYEENSGSSYAMRFITDMLSEKYPITMPYYPSEPFKVFTKELLSDPKNGDFDTIEISKVITPDGETDIIGSYWKESDHGFVEISKDEFEERRKIHEERLRNN